MKNDDHIVIDENSDLNNIICEECKKEDESVKQNLIMHGFKSVSYTHLTLPTKRIV